MTICAVIAGVLTLIAFAAHALVGTREFWRFRPSADDTDALTSWVQSVAGWQFASIDLLISTVLFFLLATTDVVTDGKLVMVLMGGYYFLVGTSWVLVVACLGAGIPGRWLKLGQWIFCYLVAALSWTGSQM